MTKIDDLKDVWNSQSASKIQFSETDIYKMVHKKSASIVKWILYISIAEFLLFSITTIFMKSSDVESEIGIASFVKAVNIINYCLILPSFIYVFYRNYKSICVNDNAKKLISDILKTKKSVSYYVYSQLILAGIVLFVTLYKFSLSDSFFKAFPEDINMLLVWVIFIFIILFFLFFIWLVYKLLYGILLSKLTFNHKELLQSEVD